MPARTIKPLPQYQSAKQEIAKSYPRAHEVFDGAEWSIARDPEEDGVYDSNLDVWRAKVRGNNIKDLPLHLILYTFDDSEVRFLTILPVEE